MRKQSEVDNFQGVDHEILENLQTATKVIRNTMGRNGLQTLLVSSVNDSSGVAEAATHIAYLMVQLGQRILLINMDCTMEEHVVSRLQPEKGDKLLKTLAGSPYMSEAIKQTQYDELNYIGIEDVDDKELMDIIDGSNLDSRLNPLRNYFDTIIIIGPDYERYERYSSIFETADSLVTISKDNTSDYRKLRTYLNESDLFKLYSLGVIRHR
ncbi:hypothetical protein FO441_01015 [Salinicoccus cyprini]|uniref:CpsD/CapB family tyrosine-protein kinase n=1 Tax=Salinicoccus cyprini TaxID=2493691 RepID=A0A558AXA6_9STAP|nr:hypothetical protein [Salinicoccus cyprini]TVT28892.1 hypothetical protein FO441_01015 [Salinicoccus cyprini]